MTERGTTSVEIDKKMSPHEILNATIANIHAIERQAEDALEDGHDPFAYRRILREKANVLVGLPNRIIDAMSRGESFPQTGLQALMHFRELALDRLDHDRTGLSFKALLTEPYSHQNTLERLRDRIYPPKTPKAKVVWSRHTDYAPFVKHRPRAKTS